jgi:hypothetical protein
MTPGVTAEGEVIVGLKGPRGRLRGPAPFFGLASLRHKPPKFFRRCKYHVGPVSHHPGRD